MLVRLEDQIEDSIEDQSKEKKEKKKKKKKRKKRSNPTAALGDLYFVTWAAAREESRKADSLQAHAWTLPCLHVALWKGGKGDFVLTRTAHNPGLPGTKGK